MSTFIGQVALTPGKSDFFPGQPNKKPYLRAQHSEA